MPSSEGGGGFGRISRRGIGGGYYDEDRRGECVCPKCNYHEIHKKGVPCFSRKCPKCGTTMNSVD